MDYLRKLFQRRNTRAISLVDTSVRISKKGIENGDNDQQWVVELQTISPVRKIKAMFSSKESLLSSRESLTDISEMSGVAYRRHPDDRKSGFGQTKSTSTSVACYGRYSMYNLGDIDMFPDNLLYQHDHEISASLTSLKRIESIQNKALNIARQRRKNLKTKQNKKRRISDDDLDEHIIVCQSMIELPLTNGHPENDMITLEARSVTVNRKSSIQKKSWEIRRQRKMRNKKLKSERYQGDRFPLLDDSKEIK